MREYEIRKCIMCGCDFAAYNKRQIICNNPDCKRARATMRGRINKQRYREQNKIWMRQHRGSKLAQEPKEDTIIAEGYAERQVAKTLASVERIDTNL